MISDSSDNAKLSELLIALLEGSISTRELAELDKQIVSNPDVRKYYIEFLTVFTGLRQPGAPFTSGTTLYGSVADKTCEALLFEELAEYEKNGEPVKVEKAKEPAGRILTQEEQQAKIRAFLAEEKALEEQERMLAELERRRVRRRELRRRKRAQQARTVVSKMRKVLKIGAVAAVVMVVAFYLCALLTPVPPVFVATLTDGIDVKWADSGQPAEPDSPLGPGTMKLVEGYARITFGEGARIILEAPAEINLENSNRAFLHLGKLSAEVPVQARGFKINTPGASITDLGTEFGVSVAEDGTSDIHVYKGRVSLLAGRFDNMTGRLFDTVEQIVEAGQAKRVKADSSKIYDIRVGHTEFARNVPPPYGFAIRKTEPIGYWDFNLNEPQCRNQIGGEIKSVKYSQDVLRTNNGPKLSNRAENGALTILSHRPPTMSLVDIPLYREQLNGFTMMFWYQPLVSSPHSIITQDLDTGQSTDFGRWFDMEINGKLTFGSGTGMNNAEKYRMLDVGEPLPLNQWTFVVVTITPRGRGRLYINGQKESSNTGYEYQFDDKHRTDSRKKYTDIVFGLFGGEQDDSFMNIELGKPIAIIDELAVYDYALSENTIRQLYNYYRPGLN